MQFNDPKKPMRAVLIAAGAAAVVVTACGGDLIAVLGALGAAGGNYTLDTNPATAALESRPVDPGNPGGDSVGFTLVIDGVTNGGQNLFDTSFPVRVAGATFGGAACTNATGTVNGDRLDLGNCFRGRFENVNRAVSDDGTVVLRFDDFSPDMSTGIWVDIQNTSRRIKFISDTTGCELKSGTPTGNTVTLVQIDSNPTTGAYNSVQNFAIGDKVWTTGVFVGASGLRLTGTPETLELERRRDDPETVCP